MRPVRVITVTFVVTLLAACGSSDFKDSDGSTSDGSTSDRSRVDSASPRADGGPPAGDVGSVSDSDVRGDAPSCGAPRISCGGDCVDPGSSAEHCGGCDNACPPDQVCQSGGCKAAPGDCRQEGCPAAYYCDINDGKCRPGCGNDDQCGSHEHCDVASHSCLCDSGYHACAGQCVVNTSVNHCGTSCTPCPNLTFAKPTCDGSKCGIQCNAGYKMCGGQCAQCPSSGVTQTACDGKACVATACAAGSFLCASGCCSWTEEQVKTTTKDAFTDLALVLDGADQPLIAFNEASWGGGNNDVTFAGHRGGSGWSSKQLVQHSYIQDLSLTLGPAGKPTLGFVYYEEGVGMKLWAGTFSGSSWSAQASDSSAYFDGLAVASKSDGALCRVAVDAGEYVEHGCWKSTSDSWSWEEVGKPDDFAAARLAFDSADQPHVLFVAQPFNDVTYARRTSSGWQLDQLGSTDQYSPAIDMLLDAQGQPAVVFALNAGLEIARRNSSGAWANETLKVGDARYPILRFDPQGNPVLSRSGYGGELFVSRKTSSGWSHLEVGTYQTDTTHGMAVDSKGKVHLLVGEGKKLMYLHD